MQAFNIVHRLRFVMLLVGIAFALPLQAAITIELKPSQPSPSTIGKVITWTVNAVDTNPGSLWYRFSARRLDKDFSVLKDFSQSNPLDWTTIDSDGVYVIQASVVNQATGE